MTPTKLPALRGRRKKPPPFERANARTNFADDAGTVQVSVILLDPERGQHQKGNQTRSFRIQNAKVSEVAQSLEAWLYKPGSTENVPHVRL